MLKINPLSHRKRLFTGTVPLINFVLIGAVPIKNCDTKRASLKKATHKRLLIKSNVLKATNKRVLINGYQ